MLILQPIGGICNRLRAINSARILAKMRKEKLVVLWFKNAELGAAYEDIFVPSEDFKVVNISSKFSLNKMAYQLRAKLFGSTVSNEDIRGNRSAGMLNESYVSTLKPFVYMATEEHFYPSDDYSPFVPAADIMKDIDRISSGFTSHTVGVHIRRTDNKPSMGKSTTDAFVSEMQKRIDADPEVNFYIATDDMEEEKNLRKLFPGRIISNEDRDLSRASVSGIKDAMIDLYCLANTSAIIGSFFSSFTDTAAAMHGIPLIIAGESQKD